MSLSHLDDEGHARMVDVSGKPDSEREATATGRVLMHAETLQLIQQGGLPKGDVIAVAQVAGIMAAKQTAQLIPMCHPLMLNNVKVSFEFDDKDQAVEITATVKTSGKTGVEMEALTAVTVSALTIYDMCKAVDRTMRLSDIRLRRKSGGKSGTLEFP